MIDAIMECFTWLPDGFRELIVGAIAIFAVYCIAKLVKLAWDIIPIA